MTVSTISCDLCGLAASLSEGISLSSVMLSVEQAYFKRIKLMQFCEYVNIKVVSVKKKKILALAL